MKRIILTIAALFALAIITPGAAAQTTYRSHTDRYGNTTTYGSNGYRSTSYTDRYGNTTTRTNKGTTYHSHTDSFGNTTTYGSDGSRSTSYTDRFGNTTTRTR